MVPVIQGSTEHTHCMYMFTEEWPDENLFLVVVKRISTDYYYFYCFSVTYLHMLVIVLHVFCLEFLNSLKCYQMKVYMWE